MPDVPMISGIVSPVQGQFPVTNASQASTGSDTGPKNAPYSGLPIFYSSYNNPQNRSPQPQRPFVVNPVTPPLGTVQVRRVPISTESPSASKKVYNGALKKPKRRLVKPNNKQRFSLFGW